MDKSTGGIFRFLKGLRCLAKWIRRFIYIILAATMIGFSNAFYDEIRMIGKTRNFVQQEQVIDDEDLNE